MIEDSKLKEAITVVNSEVIDTYKLVFVMPTKFG